MENEKTVTMSMAEYNRIMEIEQNQDKIQLCRNFNMGMYSGISSSVTFLGQNEAIILLERGHEKTVSEMTEKYQRLLQNEKTRVLGLEMEIEELQEKLKKKHWWNR